LTPICTKSFVGCSFAPNPTWGTYSAPPDPLAVFRRPTSKGRGEKGRGGKGKERKREGERGGEEGRGERNRRGEGVRPLR